MFTKLQAKLDFSKARINFANNTRGTPDDFPEIIFDNVILVSNRQSEYGNDPVDRFESIIYPKGCQNLTSPETIIVNMDLRHFDAGLSPQLLQNGGNVTKIETNQEGDQLIGQIKVGEQHVLIDKNKKVYGSAYASAFMTIAEKLASTQESIGQGRTYKDFIPQNVFDKYFKTQIVIPTFNGISVELDWNTEPQRDANGILQIKQYSIVRVAWLVNDKAGQQQSRINPQNYKLQTILKKRIMEDNKTINTLLNDCLAIASQITGEKESKLRTAEADGMDAVALDLYKRMCSCLANTEAKKREQLANTDKTRSEADVIALITELTAKVQMLQDSFDKAQAEDDKEDMTDITDTTDTMSQDGMMRTSETTLITPTPAIVEKTRIAKENNNQKINLNLV